MAGQVAMLTALVSAFLLSASASESTNTAKRATVYLYNNFGTRLTPAASQTSSSTTGSNTYSSRSASYDRSPAASYEQSYNSPNNFDSYINQPEYGGGYGQQNDYGASRDYGSQGGYANQQTYNNQPASIYVAKPYQQPSPNYNSIPSANYAVGSRGYQQQSGYQSPPPVQQVKPVQPAGYVGTQQVSAVINNPKPADKQGSYVSESYGGYDDGGYAAGFDKGYGGCPHVHAPIVGGHVGGSKLAGASIGVGAGKIIAAKTQALADVGSSIGASIGQATKGLVNGIQGLRNLAQAGLQLKSGLTRALKVIPAGILGAVNVATSAKAAVSNSFATAGKATSDGLHSTIGGGHEGVKPYSGGFSGSYTSTYH